MTLSSRVLPVFYRTKPLRRLFCGMPTSMTAIVSGEKHVVMTQNTSSNRLYSPLHKTTAQSLLKGKSAFQIRHNFSYAGPRKLDDILKVEQIQDKTKVEVSDLWMTYHEGKEKVHGLVLDGATGKSILTRAAQCPFFIHPIFRDGGHFMILSQFQSPNHFLLALLEDYKMDPARAQPLLTVSVFDDLVESKDLALVRCDIINNGIEDNEGYKLVKCLIADYSEEEAFTSVHLFNKAPDKFDVDAYLSERKEAWMADT